MTLRFADQIEPQTVEWLWPGYLPRGKVVMLDGDPGLGKSTLLCDISARLSTGGELPNGKRHDPMGVLLMMGEDGTGDTTVPRLIAAGADLSRIAIRENYIGEKGEEPPAFPNDLLRLQQDIQTARAGLVVIDPIMSYLADDINSNSDQQVRRALMPLKDLAEEENTTIVLVRHLNKMAGSNSLYRGGGSIGFVGVARVALIMAKHPEDETLRILAVNKTNLMALPPALAFRLEDNGNGAARVTWEGTTSHTAETLIGRDRDDDRATALDEAVIFLRDLLADGAVLSTSVQRSAKEAGIAWDTVRRAQRKLKITPEKAKTQDGKWVWTLPAEVVDDPPRVPNINNNNNFNIFKQDRQDVEVVEPVEDGHVVETPPPINNFAGRDQWPVVGRTGDYQCANGCGRRQYMIEGTPQLCRTCRFSFMRYGHASAD